LKVQVKRMDNLGKEYSTDTTSKLSSSQPKTQEEEEGATEETKEEHDFADLTPDENANLMTASVAYLKLINVPTMFDIGCQ
jgi:hypothetical protein